MDMAKELGEMESKINTLQEEISKSTSASDLANKALEVWGYFYRLGQMVSDAQNIMQKAYIARKVEYSVAFYKVKNPGDGLKGPSDKVAEAEGEVAIKELRTDEANKSQLFSQLMNYREATKELYLTAKLKANITIAERASGVS